MIPNRLIIGEPGSGKSVGTAALALAFPGAVFSADPHSDSLTALLLEHLDGEVLFPSDLGPGPRTGVRPAPGIEQPGRG